MVPNRSTAWSNIASTCASSQMSDGVLAGRLERRGGCRGAVGVVEVVDDNVGAFVGERDGRDLADPGVRSGDQGDLALESSGGHGVSLLVAGEGGVDDREAW